MKGIFEFASFVFSVLVTLCAIGMFIGSLIVQSPNKGMYICFTSLTVVGCVYMCITSYKEWRLEVK